MGACAQITVFTFAYAANALLCLSSVAAWAQVTGSSFSVPFFCLSVGTGDRGKLSVPFFRLSVGTGDRGKLVCTLLPPQRGHR